MAPSGPLCGLRVLEFAGIGPTPFCGMLLSDLGADVVRIDRPDGFYSPTMILSRGRRSVAVDLKAPDGVALCLDLIAAADALIEGFRPGVMERLGLGPDAALQRNPALVYGRMTGWGQTGPNALLAGHDINYLAITGALNAIGTAEQPVPPLNIIGDFGGGALYLAYGMLAALINARATGHGQVVDCAMTEGVISMLSMFHSFIDRGTWVDRRESNWFDGGAAWYRAYRCADQRWISVGAVEPQFYKVLVETAGLPSDCDRMDAANWPRMRERFAAAFARKTQAEWCAIFEGADACFAPVLDMAEAARHPHNVAREAFTERNGQLQSAPVPRFSVTPGAIQGPPPRIGEHGAGALADWGIDEARVAALVAAGAIVASVSEETADAT